VSLFFLIGTFPAMHWANTMGRRRMIIGGLTLMTVGLLILGIFPNAPFPVVLFAFALYGFFSGGPGFMQWLYPNELFPTEVRASAVGVAIGISRIGTIIGVYGTPFLIEQMGVGPAMLAAAALVGFADVLSIIMAPETKGKSLVEASRIDSNNSKASKTASS
jgi:putative MFS transporter